jgi:hypothetical protein
MSNDKFREVMIKASQAIALERLTPKDCLKKALIELENAKDTKDKILVDENINQAIFYIELGIGKC